MSEELNSLKRVSAWPLGLLRLLAYFPQQVSNGGVNSPCKLPCILWSFTVLFVVILRPVIFQTNMLTILSFHGMALPTDRFVHSTTSTGFCFVQVWLILMPYIQLHEIIKYWAGTTNLISQLFRLTNDNRRLLKLTKKLQKRNALIVALIFGIFIAVAKIMRC